MNAMTFLNEIIEYGTLGVELARFRKKYFYSSTYGQNPALINLDADNNEIANFVDNVCTDFF